MNLLFPGIKMPFAMYFKFSVSNVIFIIVIISDSTEN